MRKIQVCVLCGGKSAEHEISLLSARNIIESMDKTKYEITVIGINKNGEWHLRDASRFLVHPHDPRKIQLSTDGQQVSLVVKDNRPSLVFLAGSQAAVQLDLIFPVLHGTYGEDGTVQGLLKLANIPFVGASVLGSAVGMDKDVMKRLLKEANVATAKFLSFRSDSGKKPVFQDIVKQLGLPFFVKPANLGSSVGIHKVKQESDFAPAIEDAFRYDYKILIEEFVDGREMECAVIGNEHPIASLPGEVILGNHEFHTYEAKYYENGVVFNIPADIPKESIKKIQEESIKAYLALYCEGMARIDLFLTKDGRAVINEINTIPGFTSTSACPKLWKATGIDLPEIIDRLIAFAIDRHKKETSLKTTFG